MPRPVWPALLAAAACASCSRSAEEEAAEARAAYRAFASAVEARNAEAALQLMTPETAAKAGVEMTDEGLELAARLRPPNARVVSCAVAGDQATMKLSGRNEGAAMKGEVRLRRVEGKWKVEEESWSVQVEAEAPDRSGVPEAVRRIVDRVASEDEEEGGKAWLELGARYSSASAFLRDVKPALWDRRPVSFEMVEETFSGSGKSFRYFTVRRGKGDAIAPATVGEALRYHLWQYEDVSNSGFRGGFDEWWEAYASKHGLPP